MKQSDGKHGSEYRIDLLGTWGYPALLLLLILNGVGSPIPEDLLPLTEGYLVYTVSVAARTSSHRARHRYQRPDAVFGWPPACEDDHSADEQTVASSVPIRIAAASAEYSRLD